MVQVTVQKSIGTTATRLVGYDKNRTSLTIQNAHVSNNLYISADPSPSSTNGILIKPGMILNINSKATGPASYEYFALASAASTTVNVGEFRGLEGEKTDITLSAGASVTLNSEGTLAAAIPGSAILCGGSDGTDLRAMLTDTSGRHIVVGAAASGSALAGNPVLIGGSDGTNARRILTLPSGLLKIVLRKDDDDNVLVIDTLGDAVSAGFQVLGTTDRLYEFNGTSWDRVRHSFVQSTAGINVNGNGTTLSLFTTLMSKLTLQVIRTAGTSAYTVELQGTSGGSTFVTIGTLTSGAASDYIAVVNQPFRYIRYSVTTIGAGNTLTAQITASGR